MSTEGWPGCLFFLQYHEQKWSPCPPSLHSAASSKLKAQNTQIGESWSRRGTQVGWLGWLLQRRSEWGWDSLYWRISDCDGGYLIVGSFNEIDEDWTCVEQSHDCADWQILHTVMQNGTSSRRTDHPLDYYPEHYHKEEVYAQAQPGKSCGWRGGRRRSWRGRESKLSWRGSGGEISLLSETWRRPALSKPKHYRPRRRGRQRLGEKITTTWGSSQLYNLSHITISQQKSLK